MKKVGLLLVLLLTAALLFAGGATETKTTQTEELVITEDTSTLDSALVEIDPNKTYKEEITIVHPSKVRGDDPQKATGTDTCVEEVLVYNQMIYYNFSTGEAEPELALSWVEESANSYLFNLRKGVKFSNGEEFTADDVKWTFEERPGIVGGTSGTVVWNNVETVEVIDDYTCRIKLKKNDTDFLLKLYLPYYSLLNREACEADEKGYRIGTGGWIITEYDANVRTVFERFDDSWVWEETGVNPTKRLVYLLMTEQSARAIAVQTGEAAADSYINQIAELREMMTSDQVETAAYTAENLENFQFNMATGIFANDQNLRYAVAYGINREEVMELAQDGYGAIANSFWGINQYGYFDDFENKLEYNPELAKEYLAKSNSPKCEFTITTIGYREPQATLIQEQLQRIGFKVNVNIVDTVGLAALVKEKNYDAIIYGGSLQPIGSRFRFMVTAGTDNRANYINDELLAKFDAAVAEQDEAKRLELYKEIQIAFNDIKPFFPLYYSVTGAAWHKGVSGIIWTPNYYTDFTHVMWEI